MTAKAAFIACLATIYCGEAPAASLPVVIEKLNDAAKACGLSESHLEDVALRALESNRLRAEPNAEGWLHVHVMARQARRNSCAAHIVVQMKVSARLLPVLGNAGPVPRTTVPEIVLCNVGNDYSAPKAVFPIQIESAEEQYIRECLGSIKY